MIAARLRVGRYSASGEGGVNYVDDHGRDGW